MQDGPVALLRAWLCGVKPDVVAGKLMQGGSIVTNPAAAGKVNDSNFVFDQPQSLPRPVDPIAAAAYALIVCMMPRAANSADHASHRLRFFSISSSLCTIV